MKRSLLGLLGAGLIGLTSCSDAPRVAVAEVTQTQYTGTLQPLGVKVLIYENVADITYATGGKGKEKWTEYRIESLPDNAFIFGRDEYSDGRFEEKYAFPIVVPVMPGRLTNMPAERDMENLLVQARMSLQNKSSIKDKLQTKLGAEGYDRFRNLRPLASRNGSMIK